jgi:thiamine-phosphate pyrophosphorylase
VDKRPIQNCRLYGFVDTACLAGRDPAEVARQLIAGGADILQVRAKKEKHSKRIEIGLAVIRAAADTPVPVIINDDIEAAYETGAAGVHLGQDDWHAIPRDERHQRLMGLDILGLSTHSLPQAMEAERDGANYIGVGPIHATGTKPGRPPVGVGLIHQVAARVHTPFFAIGGITLENLGDVLDAGAARVAVVSAILKAPNVAKAAAAFKERLA